MSPLSDFQRGQIVGSHLVGESVTKTSQLLCVYCGTMSKVMAECTQRGRTSSAKQNSGWKKKLSEKDRRVLNQIVMSKSSKCDRRAKSKHLYSLVSMIKVRRYLHKQNIYGREEICKPLVTDAAETRLQWSHSQNLVD
ncbi:HTH_Tnp_Tc3_2 domain-containing protein [Trichonephila clavipes]|nr:HTH_Tnp_Tc3_2 domain-containing protein [Trichonephila clavipes]